MNDASQPDVQATCLQPGLYRGAFSKIVRRNDQAAHADLEVENCFVLDDEHVLNGAGKLCVQNIARAR